MKLYREAKKMNCTPIEYVERIRPIFNEAWRVLDIEYSRFIRTTDRSHINVVKNLAMKLYESGEIYLGTYSGLYCVDCERYYTKKELIDGKL